MPGQLAGNAEGHPLHQAGADKAVPPLVRRAAPGYPSAFFYPGNDLIDGSGGQAVTVAFIHKDKICIRATNIQPGA
jgi:hypothetical protein